MNGNTIMQNKQSAAHRLRRKRLNRALVIRLACICSYLMIKSAATFRTFGQRINAIIVSKLPKIPTIMIVIVAAAASVRSGRENLKHREIDVSKLIFC